MVQRGGPDECWPWTGHVDRWGYGRIQRGARGQGKAFAHRVAYELTVGPVPANKPFVLHGCDNPRCCNPAHLRPGTPAENVDDMRRRGRAAYQKVQRRFAESRPSVIDVLSAKMDAERAAWEEGLAR